MDEKIAIEAFAALSQSTRLRAFRLLVNAGQRGMLSGDLGKALNIKQNTMSANLSILENKGLVRSQRHGRTVSYIADFTAIRHLLSFLMEDCCGGKPELCRPVIGEIIPEPK